MELEMVEKLSTYEIQMRSDLLRRFREGTLSIEQAGVLKQLLEKEKEEVWDSGDLLLLFVIIILLGFVISFLGNKEIDLKSLNKTIDDFIYGKKKKKK
jgi:hypothetical protein